MLSYMCSIKSFLINHIFYKVLITCPNIFEVQKIKCKLAQGTKKKIMVSDTLAIENIVCHDGDLKTDCIRVSVNEAIDISTVSASIYSIWTSQQDSQFSFINIFAWFMYVRQKRHLTWPRVLIILLSYEVYIYESKFLVFSTFIILPCSLFCFQDYGKKKKYLKVKN